MVRGTQARCSHREKRLLTLHREQRGTRTLARLPFNLAKTAILLHLFRLEHTRCALQCVLSAPPAAIGRYRGSRHLQPCKFRRSPLPVAHAAYHRNELDELDALSRGHVSSLTWLDELAGKKGACLSRSGLFGRPFRRSFPGSRLPQLRSVLLPLRSTYSLSSKCAPPFPLHGSLGAHASSRYLRSSPVHLDQVSRCASSRGSASCTSRPDSGGCSGACSRHRSRALRELTCPAL